ncbi:phosphate acetyltransferase [Roseicella aquatilis]|uniref:Phosphate acetyltransferase n=1 Tax=Roseicella aquatilis TaxID=2527868 RepID=A0A4R4DST3_9PROT|nr:phosphate acetyltransferase [Roseicella aquatilis]TCZ64880.1 phosphate acetyltransferase [Roseicella aquatilis]
MDDLSAQHVFFLAPIARDVGLTSMALGLAEALRRDRIKVGFVKPIVQPLNRGGNADLSTFFARSLLHIDAPDAIPFALAEERVRTGQMDALMEDVVAIVEAARAGCDVVVVEGLIPDADLQVAAQLNAAMARSLSASLVPVISGAYCSVHGPADCVALAVRQFSEGGDHPPSVAGVLVNKLRDEAEVAAVRASLAAAGVPALAAVPFASQLDAPRLLDVVEALGLAVEHAGDLARARVREFVVAGRGVEGVIDRLRPGALVVAAGERSDIALAAGLAYMQGTPLAGLLLTCGTRLTPQVASLLQSAALGGLPILTTDEDTFATGARLANLSRHVRADDAERMEQVIAFTAEHTDTAPLRERLGRPGRLRMPPPAFRHRLVQAARRAAKRVVLPEGDEPRTLQAAAICHAKGIARCVLLGNPERIQLAAQALGLRLPEDVEIVDPEAVRGRYVEPLVRLRAGKGLTPIQAETQLEDTVVLGTMMLALDEVDGLVSGAVHTTANTIRPALQLIRTAPGATIVSSAFFMLMPEEVLVYADCAVNPDPTDSELADIAIQSADSARAFGIDPRVAMISYSTGSSGSGADVEKVRRALALARARRPGLLIDGPMQYDAASVESVGRQKAPDSPVAGRANVFVFPDLNTGNTTYKAVQRSAHVVSVGPMLQGLRKPVNDLSRGALVDDIVYTIALTAIQATQTAAPQELRAAAE